MILAIAILAWVARQSHSRQVAATALAASAWVIGIYEKSRFSENFTEYGLVRSDYW